MNSITKIIPRKERINNLNKTILSVSGWRKIFAADQKKNSLRAQITRADQEFIIVAGQVLGNFFNSQKGFIIIARDSRPTSKVITKTLIQSLIAAHAKIKFLGLNSAPQTLAYTKKLKNTAGFVYITASHNPPGYNGLKIGNANGEVINAAIADKLINQFKLAYSNNAKVLGAKKAFNNAGKKVIRIIYNQSNYDFKQSAKCYDDLIREIIMGTSSKKKAGRIISNLKKELADNKVYIGYDFNGSARLGSIDQEILKEFRVRPMTLNTKIGKFSHQIAPEREALDDLKKFLIQKRRQNINFGITFDCDGDRGNLVLYEDSQKKQLLVPDAQFTFILAVLSELAFRELFYPQRLKKTAVVTHDPTSLRINQICQKFGVKLFQAEVGEANVIELGQQLRKKGYHVPIVGEGSNGGTIIYPSTVRDPLCMIFSLLKLLYLKCPAKKTSLLQCVLKKYGKDLQAELKAQDYLRLLWQLNQDFITTSAFDPLAIMKIQTKNQKKLKQRYESIFQSEYLKKQKYLKQKYQIKNYQIINYENTKTRIGAGNRTGKETGGFKIMFYSVLKEPLGWLWTRGSKTEPAFRVMIDIKGSKKDHDYFLQWHRKMLKEADK